MRYVNSAPREKNRCSGILLLVRRIASFVCGGILLVLNKLKTFSNKIQ
jgi:hypothetical protein